MKLPILILIGPLLATSFPVKELHDNAFAHLTSLTPDGSPGHLWFLKQIDRFMLYVAVSYAPDEDRARIVSAIARFGLSIMTDESLTDSQVRMVARIIESVTSRGVYREGDIEKKIGQLAWYLKKDLGVDILSSEGFLVPPERQAVMMELLGTRLGRFSKYLVRLETGELQHLSSCYQLINSNYKDMVMHLGVDVSHMYPALQEIETVRRPHSDEGLMRMQRYSALVEEARKEAEIVTQWSIVWNSPHMIELRRGSLNEALVRGIQTCSRDNKPEIACMQFEQVREALYMFHDREIRMTQTDAQRVKSVLLYIFANEAVEEISAAIDSLRESAEQTTDIDPWIPIEDLPSDTVSQIRIKSHLVNYFTDNNSVARSVYSAILFAVDRLSLHQLEWIDDLVHSYVSFEPDLRTVCRMAFKLSQACGIKLFDFHQPVGTEADDLHRIRSVISNAVWTQWEGEREYLGHIFGPVVNLGIPLEKREEFVRAMKLYTIARMKFEQLPIEESRGLTWSGFLPDQVLMTDIEAFVKMMLAYKDHRFAAAVIPRLPEDLKEYIGSLVSPVHEFDDISRRIYTLYKTKMDSLPSRPRQIDIPHVPTYSVRKLPGYIATFVLKLGEPSDARELLENVSELICRLLDLLPGDFLQDTQITKAVETVDRTVGDVEWFAQHGRDDAISVDKALDSLRLKAEILRLAIEVLSHPTTAHPGTTH